MYKLLSFLLCLAVALAAPAPEPGAAIISPAIYKTPLTYAPALGYAAIPTAPVQYSYSYGSPLAYGAPYSPYYPYAAAPIAYSKIY